MSDPETLTAGAIATLAFQEFIKAGASELQTKFTSEAISKMGELRQKIMSRFKGHEKIEAEFIKAEAGDSEAIATLENYLNAEMRESPEFAQELQQLENEINLHIETDNSRNIQSSYGGNNTQNNISGNKHGPVKQKSAELSSTVRDIAKTLGKSIVSAFDIAEEIKRRHGEYGNHRLGKVSIDISGSSPRHEWSKWLDSVSNLYTESKLQESRHKVISGRLLLVGLGVLEPTLRESLEQQGVWAALLLEIDEAVVSENSPLSKVLNTIQLAHGFQSDRPEGNDKLGIQGEVNALCEVILDSNVAPPLAVGLFGAWGSGKSFFMEKMRERIHELTTKVSENRPPNVVQIRFNAWHYSDTSLWASLAVEIFKRLADPEPVPLRDREQWLKDRGDSNREKRKELLENLETYREAKAPLEQELNVLKQEKKQIENDRLKAEESQQAIVNTLFLSIDQELIQLISQDKQIKHSFSKISNQFKESDNIINELIVFSSKLQTTWGYLNHTWRNVKNKKWSTYLVAIAFILLIVPVVAQFVGNSSLLSTILPAVGSLAATVTAIFRYILPATEVVNTNLVQVNSIIERASKIEAELVAKNERTYELNRAKLNNRIAESTRSIVAIKEKIISLETQVESLTVGRCLYNFLADRAAGYQKHQGVVGMLHRDFRLLDAQFRAQPSAKEASGLPRIDRVILYIDDLDRCSPAKVLEVLEAVHLLLALELFIVVVGVDPRWLQRSLRHQYRNLSLSKDLAQDPYLQVMPVEYLEKIFQIPLTLPAMEDNAYSSLILSLVPDTEMPTPPSTRSPFHEPKLGAVTPNLKYEARTPTRSLIQVQAGSAADRGGGTSIDLTSDEVSFAQQLGGLVDTPRAAKRLMNTYRLIRATQHVGSRSRFLGVDGKPGQYFAVLTLLAIAAGYPRLVDRVLVALEDDTKRYEIQDWKSFLDALDPNQGNLCPEGIKSLSDGDLISLAESAEWEHMFKGLKDSFSSNKLNELDPYKKWGRTVARFSFTL